MGGTAVKEGGFKVGSKMLRTVGFDLERGGRKIYVKVYEKARRPQLLISVVGPTVVDVVDEPLDLGWHDQVERRVEYALTKKIGRQGW
jgi:hypothetical protein